MLALLSLFTAAATEPPKLASTKKDGAVAEKPEGKITAELGGALTTGNSEFYVLTAGINSSYRWKRSSIQLTGGAVAGSSRVDADANGTIDDAERAVPMIENARRFYADGRYDFFVSKRDSLFVLAGAFHDPFAGFDYRLQAQAGYSRHLYKSDDTNVTTEIGAGYARENFVDGVDPNFQDIIAVRGMVQLRHKFSEGVGFEDTVEVYENLLDFADLRVLNTASMVSTLSSKFSLKLSHVLIFDNVPVAGFRKLDQTMKVTLVASIL